MKSRFNRIICFVLALLLLPLGFLELAFPVKASYENTYENTGDQRADIIGVALTQVGYREESGGFTKYGAWYGSSYMDWCGAFISWCANQAAVPNSVLRKTGYAAPSYFGLTDVFRYSSGRVPQPGDLFFRVENNIYKHAGLVYYVEGSYFYTLEGNTWADGDSTHRVMTRKRSLTGSFVFASPQYTTDVGHNYVKGYESAHPHKEYYQCTDANCGSKYYTGKNGTSSNCLTCKQENCTHQYGSWKKVDGTNHSGTCSLCEKVKNFNHDWIDGEVKKEATCKDTGILAQSCKQCKATREVDIPVTEEHTFGDWQYINSEGHSMICEVCEKAEEGPHIQSQEQSADPLSHWYTCTDCGGRIGGAAHQFSGNCESACADCGYVSPTGHMYGTVWTTDGDAHWYACQKCSAVKDRQKHVFSSGCDDTCDTCGYTRKTAHSYGSAWKSDGTGHWKTCEVCFQRSEVEAHASDAAWTEEQALICSACHYEIAPAMAHEHVYTISSHDRSGHHGVCACGEAMEATAHVWNPETEKCSICQEPVPTTGRQSAILQFVVEKVGVSPYLWLIMVLPLVAVLAILLLIVFLLLTIRKRSRDIEYDDDDDDFYDDDGDGGEGSDGGGEAEAQPEPESQQPEPEEKIGMEPLSI